MTKSMAIVLAVVGLLVGAGAAQAQLLGYWNAANPANAGTTVEDLSSSNYDMTLVGNVTDAGNTWNFPGGTGNFIQGTGNESIYDFDTAIGTGADPYTVVAVYDLNITGDHFPHLVAKDDSNFTGWTIAARGDNNNYDMYQQPGTNQARMYNRAPGTTSGVSLVVWHHDGSGTVAGNLVYHNGGLIANGAIVDSLNGSMLNDEPIRIGGIPLTANSTNGYYSGDIWWAQIWGGDESTLPGGSAAAFAALTYNQGDFLPIIPEPATMALLGIGGLMVLRRRRA